MERDPRSAAPKDFVLRTYDALAPGLETRIFPAETSAADILAWAGGLPSSGGRLIITHPAADEPDNEPA